MCITSAGKKTEEGRSGSTERMERIIASTLRAGVLLSVAVIVLGLCLSFARHPEYATATGADGNMTGDSYRFAHSLGETGAGVLRLEGRSIVTLGLLTLIATPVIRVALSFVVFAAQRDRAYTVITAAVLFFLLVSFLVGLAG